MRYTFTASITKEGKWFVARAVEFGVASQGRSIEQAKRNLGEAVELYLTDEPRAKTFAGRETPLLTMLEVRV